MYLFFKRWNVMRLLRLAIGVMAIVQAYQQNSWILGIASFFVIIAAIANLGCCSSNSCSANMYKHNKNSTEKITYEELGK